MRSFVMCVDRGEGFLGGLCSEGGPRGLAPELTANEKPSEALCTLNMATLLPPDLGFDLPKCLTSQFPTGHPLPSGQQHTYSSSRSITLLHTSEKIIIPQ